LVLGHSGASARHHNLAQSDDAVSGLPSIVTAQLEQNIITKAVGNEHGTGCRTLADGIKAVRKQLPTTLCKQLQELNSAGSYDRHHGATIDKPLLHELEVALSEVEHVDSSCESMVHQRGSRFADP
jgi:hypothetical protein